MILPLGGGGCAPGGSRWGLRLFHFYSPEPAERDRSPRVIERQENGKAG